MFGLSKFAKPLRLALCDAGATCPATLWTIIRESMPTGLHRAAPSLTIRNPPCTSKEISIPRGSTRLCHRGNGRCLAHCSTIGRQPRRSEFLQCSRTASSGPGRKPGPRCWQPPKPCANSGSSKVIRWVFGCPTARPWCWSGLRPTIWAPGTARSTPLSVATCWRT